jgi:hypothetical protein
MALGLGFGMTFVWGSSHEGLLFRFILHCKEERCFVADHLFAHNDEVH